MQLIRGPAASRPDTIAFRDPAIATRIALPSLARCILELSTEIAELDELIAPLVEALAPQMLRRVGFASKVVGQLLVTAGDNPERLSREAAWAMPCGSAPLPASSGQTRRHRLNRGGDRAANIGPATKSMLPPDRYDALVAEFHTNDPRVIRRARRLSFQYLDRHGSVARGYPNRVSGTGSCSATRRT
jgi:hypothetical protein